MQQASKDILHQKYCLPDETSPIHIFKRVADALANVEKDNKGRWSQEFFDAMMSGCIPAGRILSNAGAEHFKGSTSLINCTVSNAIHDSLPGILEAVNEAGKTLHAGCGIGYEFSTIRPKGAFVSGVGAETSGPLPFMDIFDAMCKTISSAGGRRGAQMATFDVHHPDILDFIKAKREPGRFRQFNCSVLINHQFIEAVLNDDKWELSFPIKADEYGILAASETTWRPFPAEADDDYLWEGGKAACRIYEEVRAVDIWEAIMDSTFNFNEPGVLFIDNANRTNPLNWCENFRATNPCAEQWLPPYGSCLLGSIDLSRFVENPLTDQAYFDWNKLHKLIPTFTRMLDNVVEISNLPLPEQQFELEQKRRHGMGIMGVGTALNLLGIKYGSLEAADLLRKVCKAIAIVGMQTNINLAIEKGGAPIFEGNPDSMTWYKEKFKDLLSDKDFEDIDEHGLRFSHHTSIAPTGTIAFSIGNNCSNGIEPTYAHVTKRNVIIPGKAAKEQMTVYSKELLMWREMGHEDAPDWFVDVKDLTPEDHIRMMEAAQPWVDSAISKTVNVPTGIDYDDFKDLYLHAWRAGLKGCATYRYVPENTSTGVLVDPEDLAKTKVIFTLPDGSKMECQATEELLYKGEVYTAANLADAINEGLLNRL